MSDTVESINGTGIGTPRAADSRDGGLDSEGCLGQTRPTGIMATGVKRRELDEGRAVGTDRKLASSGRRNSKR